MRKAQLDEKDFSDRLDEKFAHLANLNEDPMLSYVISHQLNREETSIGSRNSDICLTGLSILERHALIRRENNGNYQIQPADFTAKIKINGYNLTG